MFTGMLHTHKLAVMLFLLLYLVKATLLVLNRNDALDRFTRVMKVPEMIISVLFLLTGVILALNSGVIGAWFWVKMVAVFSSIPLAIIAFRRKHKAMALLAVMFIVYAYGISETRSVTFKAADLRTAFENVPSDRLGKAVYESQCVNCHGADGKAGRSGAKDLTVSKLSPDEKLAVIRDGKNAMIPYKNRLSEDQIAAVAGYVETLKAGR